MNSSEPMKYAALPMTEEPDVQYVPVEMNASNVQYVPVEMNASNVQFVPIEMNTAGVPQTMHAGQCAPIEQRPRPELQQLQTAFWVFMGGFAIPRLLMMIIWLGLGISLSYHSYHDRQERDADLSILVWIFFIWLAIMALTVATLACALYGSIRLFLLARQFSTAQGLAIAQLFACCLLAFLTLGDEVTSISFYVPMFLLFAIFAVLFSVCVALFWRCASVVRRELEATLPLTAPCHHVDAPGHQVPVRAAIDAPSVDFKGSF